MNLAHKLVLTRLTTCNFTVQLENIVAAGGTFIWYVDL